MSTRKSLPVWFSGLGYCEDVARVAYDLHALYCVMISKKKACVAEPLVQRYRAFQFVNVAHEPTAFLSPASQHTISYHLFPLTRAYFPSLFSTMYGLTTLLPLIRQDSPYCTPLSIPPYQPGSCTPAYNMEPLKFSSSSPLVLTVAFSSGNAIMTWEIVIVGCEKTAEEAASERSSAEIDVRILGWTG